MRKLEATALAGLVATLVACGGGGGGDAAGAPTDGGGSLDENQADVVLSVALYDALAGTERMMARASADAQLAAYPGAAATTACSSGSITTQKTGANTFTLIAQNCRLAANDGLVYDGTWTFMMNGNTYAADGSCPATTACMLQAMVNVSAARFGYGTATEAVVGGMYQVDTSAAGAHSVFLHVAGAPLQVPDVGTFIVNGRSSAFTVDSTGGARLADIAAATRDNMQVRQPIRANLRLNATEVMGDLLDANGQVTGTVRVAWSDFL